MKLKTKLAVATVATLIIGGQVFANTNAVEKFKSEFSTWVAERMEIRQNTTDREITESVANTTRVKEAELAAKKEEIIKELETLFAEQLEKGADVEAFTQEYIAALEEQEVIELAKVNASFAEFRKAQLAKVEAEAAKFEANQLATAKSEITTLKDTKIAEIKKAMADQTAKSKEELAAEILEARENLIEEMRVLKNAAKEEALNHFDAQMADLMAQLPVLEAEYQAEMINETNKAIEAAKAEIQKVADTVGVSK